MSDVYVEQSNIHQFQSGKGVFAARDFRKGETVVRYTLKPITAAELEELPLQEKEFVHNPRRSNISLLRAREVYKPLYHPQYSSRPWEAGGIALRDIKRGGEITTDARKDEA